MAIDRQNYPRTVGEKSPPSPLWRNVLKAFLIGGAICAIGQGIHDLWKLAHLSETAAAAATSASLIFIGALLTGLNVYDDIAKHGGAGTLVPITGFSNAVVSAALEFKSEGYVLGMSAKMFTIAGPVLVFGVCASIFYGLLVCLVRGGA